jgi:hypothetical protein
MKPEFNENSSFIYNSQFFSRLYRNFTDSPRIITCIVYLTTTALVTYIGNLRWDFVNHCLSLYIISGFSRAGCGSDGSCGCSLVVGVRIWVVVRAGLWFEGVWLALEM